MGFSGFPAEGDFDGDGKEELAVLLHSIDTIDIAPYYRLVVFNLLGNQINVLYEQVFVDASTEFRSSFQQSENSIRFANIDDDGKDDY